MYNLYKEVLFSFLVIFILLNSLIESLSNFQDYSTPLPHISQDLYLISIPLPLFPFLTSQDRPEILRNSANSVRIGCCGIPPLNHYPYATRSKT